MAQLYSSLLTIALVGILLYTDTSLGLGINCRGSSECGLTGNSLNQLVATVCNLPLENLFGPGVRIASNCHILGGIAAFTQSTANSITAGEACDLLHKLQNHGCNVCGSVPFQNNDVKQGQLTVNYVGQCG